MEERLSCDLQREEDERQYHLLARSHVKTLAALGTVADLLCRRWLFTRWPAARADMRDSSPARTVPHTTRASWTAFPPGLSPWGPCTPSIWARRDERKERRGRELNCTTNTQDLFIRATPNFQGYETKHLQSLETASCDIPTPFPSNLEAGCLGGKDGAPTHCPYLYGRHGTGHVQVFS